MAVDRKIVLRQVDWNLVRVLPIRSQPALKDHEVGLSDLGIDRVGPFHRAIVIRAIRNWARTRPALLAAVLARR